jgi:hypothetical protein
MDWGTLDELDAIWKHTTAVFLEGGFRELFTPRD